MSLKLYRPGPAGLEPAPTEHGDWRARLRSRRWRPARLANTEAVAVRGASAVLVFGGLALATFVLLFLGYLSGFWA
ncbi:MAG TPA: hypothetical protein VFK38_05780 [Candidatus Limnocylindrales bacterium]|nr:hypothetical protein [Candidatus Limnocylindrales bacterium]